MIFNNYAFTCGSLSINHNEPTCEVLALFRRRHVRFRRVKCLYQGLSQPEMGTVGLESESLTDGSLRLKECEWAFLKFLFLVE